MSLAYVLRGGALRTFGRHFHYATRLPPVRVVCLRPGRPSDERMACFSNAANNKFNPPNNQHHSPPHPRTVRDLIKQYGPAALVLYLCISSTTFSLTFVALWNGMDVRGYKQRLYDLMGISSTDDGEDEAAAKGRQEVKELPQQTEWSWQRCATTFALAFAINKMFIPLKVPLLVFLTPRFSRFFNLWRRRSRSQSQQP